MCLWRLAELLDRTTLVDRHVLMIDHFGVPRWAWPWRKAFVPLTITTFVMLRLYTATEGGTSMCLASGIKRVHSHAPRAVQSGSARVSKLLRFRGGEETSQTPSVDNGTPQTAEMIRRLEKLQGDYDYIQKEYVSIDSGLCTGFEILCRRYLHELEILEKSYEAKYKTLLEKRADVVRGRPDERPLCGFWIVAMLNHDYLRRFISKEDQK